MSDATLDERVPAVPSLQVPGRDQPGSTVSPPTDPLADRLRDEPAWRLLVLATGTVLVALVAIATLVAIADATVQYSPPPGPIHQAAVGLPTVLVLYGLGQRFVLPGPVDWYHAGRPGRQLFGWTAVGLALPAVVLGFQLVALDVTVVRPPRPPGSAAWLVAASLAAGLLAGVLEELAIRGALLRLLEARWGPGVAVGTTAVVFALLHQGHARGRLELALVLAAMLAAGLLLGVIVVRTRSVWNAVAVHAGWNAVFGGRVVAVGRPESALASGILRARLHETSVWLTGGEATLGASPVTTGFLFGAALLVARSGLVSGGGSAPAGGFPEDR